MRSFGVRPHPEENHVDCEGSRLHRGQNTGRGEGNGKNASDQSLQTRKNESNI